MLRTLRAHLPRALLVMETMAWIVAVVLCVIVVVATMGIYEYRPPAQEQHAPAATPPEPHILHFVASETVFMSANGKTFHRDRSCMALRRSREVYQADRQSAEAHGLKPCGICYRPAAKSKKGPANGWATKENQ